MAAGQRSRQYLGVLGVAALALLASCVPHASPSDPLVYTLSATDRCRAAPTTAARARCEASCRATGVECPNALSLERRLRPGLERAAVSLEADAERLYRTGRLHEARRSADSAATLHSMSGHAWRAARVAPLRTRILLALGDVDAADVVATEGIAILAGTGDARDVSELHVGRGLVHAARGNREASQSSFLEANRLRRVIEDDAVELDLMFGALALALGRPELAQKAWDRAEPFAAEHFAAGGHRLQGEIHYARGEIGAAMAQRGQALGLAIDEDDTASQISDLLAISDLLLEAGRPGRARVFADEGLTLATAAGLPRHRALTLVRLGRVAEEQGARKSAACHYRAAAAAWAPWTGPERYWATVGLWRLGNLCGVDVEHQPQLPGFSPGEPSVTPRTIEAAALVARTLLERGDRAGAAEALTRVDALLRSHVPPSVAWRVHHLVGMTWRELGGVVRSREQHALAVDGLERLRKDLAGQSLRFELASARRPVYEAAVDAWIGRSVPPPPEHHRVRAFGAAQALKARGVLDLLDAGSPRSGAAEAMDMRAERALLRQIAAEETADAERLAVLARLPGLWAKPRRSRTASRPSPATEIAAKLPAGTLLAEFLLGERVSYLWLVDNEDVRLVYLPGRDVVMPILTAYQETLLLPRMGRADIDAHVALGAQLAQHLFQDALPEVSRARRLVVAGDGALHGLPFAALVLSPSLRDGAPDYLVRHVPVTQVPSGSAWLALVRREQSRDPYGLELLGVSDPALVDGRAPLRVDVEFGEEGVTFVTSQERGPQLPRLPQARRELDAISRLARRGDKVTLLGEDATETAVLDAAPRGARYVHFATHGLSDAAPRLPHAVAQVHRAEEPALVLTPDGESDGLLGVDEIMAWGLRSELVVLSGCSTGRGWAERGDESYGLSAAFLHGGSRRVVASLWSVADRQTRGLMVRFYRELRRGLSPDQALRAAQLHMLGTAPTRHVHTRGIEGITAAAPEARAEPATPILPPFYWAPFVVIGD